MGIKQNKELLQETSPSAVIAEYSSVRQFSEHLCQPLENDDFNLQAAPFTSPAKWHLAHTSWFFETFILKLFVAGYTPFQPEFEMLFNSYYNGIGEQYPRPKRHLLSRPTVAEVFAYRAAIDSAMIELLDDAPEHCADEIYARTALGLQHEMQHQELLLTDLKYCLAENPLAPAYIPRSHQSNTNTAVLNETLNDRAQALRWTAHDGGLVNIGAEETGFCFDNETPAHQVYLQPFEIASRPVTNGEVIDFINDNGYQNASLWLSDGWAELNTHHWQHPLYWRKQDDRWFEFTLHGLEPVNPAATASHLSAYEADAIARWLDARLPTEFEWETVARQQRSASSTLDLKGHFAEQGIFHPGVADTDSVFGSIWQWTSSSYSPYPGYQASPGAIGEYNGKFMCNQLVLRGGSCLTPGAQIRSSYRNFFYPPDRWQCSGIRLARNLA